MIVINGLLQIIVAASSHNPFAVTTHGLGRYRDDGDMGEVRRTLQAGGSFHAIDTGEVDVHENQIWLLTGRDGNSLQSVFSLNEFIAFFAEQAFDQPTILKVVFDVIR